MVAVLRGWTRCCTNDEKGSCHGSRFFDERETAFRTLESPRGLSASYKTAGMAIDKLSGFAARTVIAGLYLALVVVFYAKADEVWDREDDPSKYCYTKRCI